MLRTAVTLAVAAAFVGTHAKPLGDNPIGVIAAVANELPSSLESVVAVNVQEPVDTARGYAERYGLDYTIGVDTYAAIMKTYGVFGLPTHYFIDRQGVIRDRYFGPLERDQMEQRVTLISQP